MKKVCLIIMITLLFPLQSIATPFFLLSSYSSEHLYKQFVITKTLKAKSALIDSSTPSQRYLTFVSKITSAKQAAQLVKNSYGGKILSVNSSHFNAVKGYKVKLVNKNGKVLTVFVNASSGRISQL